MLFVSLFVAKKGLFGCIGLRCAEVHLFIGVLARYFVVAKDHFARSPQDRVVLNQMVHLLAHLTRVVRLFIYEVVHVADLTVDDIEQAMDRRLTLIRKRLRQLRQHLNSSALVERDLMHVALLVDEEQFALRLLASAEHVNVGERVDLFFAIDIHKMSHLLLSY